MLVKSTAIFRKAALAMIVLTNVIGGSAAQASTVKTTQSTPSRVTGSVYCVHGTVTVKGWEKDLVKRNPGLRRFNWTPITAAKPGVMVFRQRDIKQIVKQSANQSINQTVNQYHYSKPRVLSYAEMRAAQKIQLGQEQRTAQETAARMNTSDVQAQLVSTYAGASLSQPASYSSAYSTADNQRKVHGRLISSHY